MNNKVKYAVWGFIGFILIAGVAGISNEQENEVSGIDTSKLIDREIQYDYKQPEWYENSKVTNYKAVFIEGCMSEDATRSFCECTWDEVVDRNSSISGLERYISRLQDDTNEIFEISISCIGEFDF